MLLMHHLVTTYLTATFNSSKRNYCSLKLNFKCPQVTQNSCLQFWKNKAFACRVKNT